MSELILHEDFFAPASTDLIDSLLGQYKQLRSDIEMMSGIVSTHAASVHHFINGNSLKQGRCIPNVTDVFKIDGAIASLNADFWQKALNLTDVYEYMPNERRNEWSEQIHELKAPDFEEEIVRPTIRELLNSRQQFFSERVDGIFRALSGEHVTNRPEGFGKRMILARVFNEYGHTNYEVSGYISDLRQVIAKFMGRDNPTRNATESMLYSARGMHGEWLTVDGGALRVRAYLKGTAHLEVHPDMAWRLNCILAHLYPMAIPAAFRQKPKRKLKDFVMMGHPLPFAVINELLELSIERNVPVKRSWGEPIEPVTKNPYNRRFKYCEHDNAVRAQAESVLQSIGGVPVHREGKFRDCTVWEFDYDPGDAIREIIASGCIPDQKSHQFYPTPASLAERCIQLADIGPNDACLEPSAGMGGLAEFMPQNLTTCVEISPVHCRVLEAKGFSVVQADFIKWAESQNAKFDRIVMNPPFSEGRAVAHVQAAAECLKPGGRLVAIMPSGNKDKDILPGWQVDWSEPISNEFAGTSISVVILTAIREE